MNKANLILTIFIFLVSCGIKKQSTQESQNIKTLTGKEGEGILYKNDIVNLVIENNISPEWTSLNGKIKSNINGKETTIKTNILIKKDSAIFISLRAPFGIEILRSVITPDSIYYLSRLEKTYFIKPLSHIKNILKAEITYSEIQDILFASPKILDDNYRHEYQENNKYSLLESARAIYHINNETFRVERLELIEFNSKKVNIIFSEWTPVLESLEKHYLFPKHMYIDIKSEEKMIFEINYSKIEFNKRSRLNFNIPKSYVEIH